MSDQVETVEIILAIPWNEMNGDTAILAFTSKEKADMIFAKLYAYQESRPQYNAGANKNYDAEVAEWESAHPAGEVGARAMSFDQQTVVLDRSVL